MNASQRRIAVCVSQLAGLLAAVATGALAVPCAAQHTDVLVQNMQGRLATGAADFDAGGWTLGARVFAREFPSLFYMNNPGFNALPIDSPAMPGGAGPLPVETELQWDFLPATIDGVARTLHYWDGSGSVGFSSPPASTYYLALRSRGGAYFNATGGSEVVTAGAIAKSDEFGGIHEHQIFVLDDGDDSLETDPLDGIYLAAMRLRVAGVDRAPAVIFVFGTPGSSLQALQDAENWADQRLEQLVAEYAADADGDLNVDGGDLASWSGGFGATGTAALQVAGDFTDDDRVDGADFLVWQRQYGNSLATWPGAASVAGAAGAVAEPAGGTLAGLAIAAIGAAVAFRRRRLLATP